MPWLSELMIHTAIFSRMNNNSDSELQYTFFLSHRARCVFGSQTRFLPCVTDEKYTIMHHLYINIHV